MSQVAQHPIEFWRVNAFTDTPFTGNPAGVVPQAERLSVIIFSWLVSYQGELVPVRQRERLPAGATVVENRGHQSALYFGHFLWAKNQFSRSSEVLLVFTNEHIDVNVAAQQLLSKLNCHTKTPPLRCLSLDQALAFSRVFQRKK